MEGEGVSLGVGGGGVEIRCHRQSSHKLKNSWVAINSRSRLSAPLLRWVSHEKVQSRTQSPLAWRVWVKAGGGGESWGRKEKSCYRGN